MSQNMKVKGKFNGEGGKNIRRRGNKYKGAGKVCSVVLQSRVGDTTDQIG